MQETEPPSADNPLYGLENVHTQGGLEFCPWSFFFRSYLVMKLFLAECLLNRTTINDKKFNTLYFSYQRSSKDIVNR